VRVGGNAPSPENVFDFGSQNVDFWYIMGAICSSATCCTPKKLLLGLENLLLHAQTASLKLEGHPVETLVSPNRRV